jgi:hypothetical protein
LCNPGSTNWEDTLSDLHPYKRAPFLPTGLEELRTANPKGLNPDRFPVFFSEGGNCSAVDLPRLVRHFEQIGHEDSEDARLYRSFLDRFMKDWQRWNMAETFVSPEEYFRQCVAKMGGLRSLYLNAVRSNPLCVGYSMSGTFDHGFCGEGAMTSAFRDLKPGAADVLFDGFYPLRLCLFAEPAHAYRGGKMMIEAVLANEDALMPGDYPVRLLVVGPDKRVLFDTIRTVKIPDAATKSAFAFAFPVLKEEIVVDGPSGKYQFLAACQRGGAAMGGKAEFYVTDPSDMPKVDTEVFLWGEDPVLAKWLNEQHIRVQALPADKQSRREIILVGSKPADGDAAAWRGLIQHAMRGSTVIFLSHTIFKKGKDLVGWAPLIKKGTLERPMRWYQTDWFYPHDPWTRKHPFFDGLQADGLMDYTYYRNILSDTLWSGLDTPDELVAASINTSFTYDAGILLGIYRVGAGRVILNTFWIIEQLGQDPVAERLLRNMLRDAAAEAAQPLADLPPDSEKRLKDMGY